MVMCRPEMLIRWPTPVRQKTCQSSCAMASWSPMASATSDAAEAPLAEALRHGIANLAAPAMQRVRPAIDACGSQRGRGLAAHVAGGADAALERPGLEVEGVRIREAARSLQAHDELPSLPGHELRWRSHLRSTLPRFHEPCERDVPGHGGSRSAHPIDVQCEARSPLVRLRKARDNSRDLDVTAFPLEGECLRQPRFRPPCRPARTAEDARHQAHDRTRRDPARRDECQDQQRRDGEHPDARLRKRRLLLEPGRAENEGEREESHDRQQTRVRRTRRQALPPEIACRVTMLVRTAGRRNK